jgi:hypothetical protein
MELNELGHEDLWDLVSENDALDPAVPGKRLQQDRYVVPESVLSKSCRKTSAARGLDSSREELWYTHGVDGEVGAFPTIRQAADL